MMFILIIINIFISNISAGDHIFKINPSVSAVGGLDTNPIYREEGAKVDAFLNVEPRLGASYNYRELTLSMNTGMGYTQYLKYAEQSFLKWNVNSKIDLIPDKNTHIDLINDYISSSDPTIAEGEDRFKWFKHNYAINTYYSDDEEFWKLKGSFESFRIDYTEDYLRHLDNQKRFFSLTNWFYFLPETAIIFGVRSGYSSYLSGLATDSYLNSDSVIYEGFLGFDGRVTSSVTLLVKVGWQYLDYEYETDFSQPFFNIEFKDLINAVNSVTAGFERRAYDSTYSNFYLDQKLYMEYKSIFFDNYIVIGKAQYINRTYKEPNRRLDNRLGLMGEISMPVIKISKTFNNLSLILTGLIEWVDSDAYNLFEYVYPGSSELSVTYRRMLGTIGLTTEF